MSHALPAETHPIVAIVRRFVEAEVLPVASALEHADAYPHALVARMKALGLFGALIPEAHGGLGLSVSAYARIIEELCRGFMSLAGVINSHTMAALIVLHHGTDEQRRRFLPRFARGEARGGLCLTEPHAGSDVQAIRTVARRAGDCYLLTGTKMFVTNGREGNTFALLARTDTATDPPHRGMSCFIVEKGHPGLQVVKSIAKLGYKGVDTAELSLDGFAVPAANLVGGVEGRGFKHVMSGLETGRINIAARAVGVAQAGLDEARDALRARPEGTEALPALADMAIRVEASRLLTYWAAGMKDRNERCDLEAGMAKLHASEAAQEVAVGAMRVMGPSSQRLDGTIERLYRDTPLMLIGEGANEIQRLLIARQLLERYGERFGALTSREGEPDERREIVLAVRRFVEKDVVPVTQEHDLAGRYPAGLVEQLAELGVLGAVVPPEHGGLGLDPLTAVMIIEEVARGWGMLGTLLAGHLAATWAVAHHARPEEHRRLLPPMTRADFLGAPAVAGPVAARPAGSDWRLAGTVPAVENAARARLLVVCAAVDGAGAGAFLVDRGAPGVALGAPLETLGMRGLGAADIRLEEVLVPASRRLGADDRQSAEAVAALETLARLGGAATAVGIAQAAFEAALRYSQQRSTFGKPICQHQAIQLKLADMATRTTAARLLTYRAARLLAGGAGAGLAADMARLEAAETAYQVSLESMRTHGGYGYTKEFPVERHYRDAAALLAGDASTGAARRSIGGRLLQEGTA
ncbi:MAG: acyl-CoA dehydrogenase family protein [Candidatus Rokubacteria bacterium]|nr:acyl-CoA dehydrogenase family protein [Candidatus Rokubacteria bacterium]